MDVSSQWMNSMRKLSDTTSPSMAPMKAMRKAMNRPSRSWLPR